MPDTVAYIVSEADRWIVVDQNIDAVLVVLVGDLGGSNHTLAGGDALS